MVSKKEMDLKETPGLCMTFTKLFDFFVPQSLSLSADLWSISPWTHPRFYYMFHSWSTLKALLSPTSRLTKIVKVKTPHISNLSRSIWNSTPLTVKSRSIKALAYSTLLAVGARLRGPATTRVTVSVSSWSPASPGNLYSALLFSFYFFFFLNPPTRCLAHSLHWLRTYAF